MVKTIPIGEGKTMVISSNRDGTDTIPSPASNDTVEVIIFKANNVAHVDVKSCYSSKIRLCKSSNELARALAKPKMHTQRRNVGSTPKPKQEGAEPEHSEPNLKKMNRDEFKGYDNIKAKNGIALDEETGEVAWEYRKLKSLKRSWRRQAYLIFNSAPWQTSVGVTVHLDTFPTFEDMSKRSEDFGRHIKRKYKGEFRCNFIFLEPCFDGSWHVHFILNFYNAFPENFKSEVKKWWRKHNNVANLTQVKFSYFKSFEDLENYVEYLNPANVEKKRNRVRFYPKSSQPMRHCGEVEAPNIALAIYDTAKKLVGSDKPTKRTRTQVFDVATNELLYSHATYHHYKPNLKCDAVYSRESTKVEEKSEEPQAPKRYEQLTLFSVSEPLERYGEERLRRKQDYKYAIATGEHFTLSNCFT